MLESTRTLETELKLFRQEKEAEMRVLLSEFVRLQQLTNDRLKLQWAQFLSRAEAKDPSIAGGSQD
jgi:hypothetical protein